MRALRMILTLLALLFAITAGAQPRLEWSRNYGGQDEDGCSDLTLTPADGYLLVGYDRSFGHFNWDGWIVCLDGNGDSLWSREFGGDEWDFLSRVLPVDGGYIVAGRTQSYGDNLPAENLWILRLNDDGEEVWSRTYGTQNRSSSPFGLKANSDGGFSISSHNNAQEDLLLQKFDDDGRMEWESYFGSDAVDERTYNHSQLADDGFIVCGEVEVPADDNTPNGILVRTNRNGDAVWMREYGGREFNALYGAVELPDGNIAAAGSFNHDAWLLILNGDGEIIESHVYQDNRYAYVTDVKLLEDGGFLLLGNRNGVCLFRTDAEGELLWTLNPPNGNDGVPEVVFTPDGGLAVGYSSRNNFAIAKYGSDPALGWPRWNELPAVVMNEDESFDLLNDWLDGYVEDTDNDSSGLTFTVAEGRHIAVEAIDGGFRLTPEANWFGADSIALTVTDPDSHWAVTELAIQVDPVNDLPLAFSLLSPEDGYNLNAEQIGFIWEEATQNEFEPDSIRYRLVMAMGDSQLVIRNLENTQLVFRGIDSLRGQFGIEEGGGFTVTWWIEAVDRCGFTESTERWTISVMGFEGVGSEADVPARFCLFSASPNPFNSSTIIRFMVPSSSFVRLTLHDFAGREVRVSESASMQAGEHSIAIDGGSLPAGLYLVRLEAGGSQAVRKIVLMR